MPKLQEIYILPMIKDGKFIKMGGMKATYQELSNILGFEPSGPNSKEYAQQHEVGAIFAFRDENGREGWVWLDDKVPLALLTSIHSWAFAGDYELLGELFPQLLESLNLKLKKDEKHNTNSGDGSEHG